MKLKILSFSGESFARDDIESITMMTALGEITILDDHAPLVTSMKPSTLFVKYKDDGVHIKRDDFAVGAGVVEVSNNEVKIMADMLVDIDDVDPKAADQARVKALEMMEKYKNATDKVDMEKFIEAEDMLLKSIAQLKLHDTLK